MSRSRVQHRPPRETPAKEESRLRQENRSLKRQVARLQKQLAQGISTIPDVEEIVTEPDMNRPRCPTCSSTDIRSFTTPGRKVIKTCGACKKRLSNAA